MVEFHCCKRASIEEELPPQLTAVVPFGGRCRPDESWKDPDSVTDKAILPFDVRWGEGSAPPSA